MSGIGRLGWYKKNLSEISAVEYVNHSLKTKLTVLMLPTHIEGWIHIDGVGKFGVRGPEDGIDDLILEAEEMGYEHLVAEKADVERRITEHEKDMKWLKAITGVKEL